MGKRPLCLAAALLLAVLWILPGDVWLKKPEIPSGESVTLTGRVTKREQKEDKQVYYLKQCLCSGTDSEISVLAYTPKGDSYPIGCELSLYGTIYQLNRADNPGQFDQESYYQSQGILYTFQAEGVLEAGGENFLGETIACLRERLGERIMDIYGEGNGGILKAVLLGDRASLREEDRLLYQKNGISHLLAISGLHISMIGMSLYRLLRKCNRTFLEAGIPSGLLLILYGMMTGAGISAVRAIGMFLVMLFADFQGRAYDMASAMSLMAIIILVRNPLQARQAGFLLSFGAVFGICCIYPVLQSVLKMEKKLPGILLLSLSLQLVTYPLTLHFFYEYPPYSIFLNLIVIPCMPLVMGFGGLSILGDCISPSVGKALGLPVHLLLSFYRVLGEKVLELPLGNVRLGRERPWQLLVYYGLLFLGLLLLWYGRRRIYGVFLTAALVLVTLRFRGGLLFTMLDVGQGDGLFFRFPGGTTCFIDGGSNSVKNVGKYRILPYLKQEGVTKLDYVIFTHFDEDHINGMREILEMTGSRDGVLAETVLFPDLANPDEAFQEMQALAEENGIQVKTIGAGDKIRGEDWELECLYPIRKSFCRDKNENSTVLKLHYQNFSMLLTGDLGKEGEERLLQAGCLEDIDVWKVSHHGSKNSGKEEFLERIAPNVSLISVGENRYGHPSEEMLGRLSEIGSYVKTTWENGALSIESDGKTYVLSLQREGD